MIDPQKADLYAAIGVALGCMAKHRDEPLVGGAAKVLSDFIRSEEEAHQHQPQTTFTQKLALDERQRLIERISDLEAQLSASDTSRMQWAFRAGIASGVASRYSKSAISEIKELCGDWHKTGDGNDTKD